MAKHKTNTEMMTDLMEFSPHGALCQAFILEAVRVYADKYADLDPAELEASGNWGMLSPFAWVGVAKDVKKRLADHLK